MSLLAPLGLLALLTLPVIVILHMLRERRRRVVVPSLLLWQLMPRKQEAQRRRRLPLTLLLLLHLLAAALLGFALAKPQWSLALFEGERHTAVIIDTSTSMAAPAPGGGTRLEVARARARDLIGAMGTRGSVTLIAAGAQARLLDSAGVDGAPRLLAALEAIEAAGTGTDLASALTLAEAALQGRPAPRVVVITDAALPALAATLNGRPAPLPIEWQSVGAQLDNRAIVALATRARGSGPVQVYARAVNYGARPIHTLLRLYGDGQLLDTRPVTLQANGEAELTWAVPRGVALLRAELDGDDGLPTDDTASVSLLQTRPVRALLVSASPDALERALRAVPGLELTIMDPIAYAGSDADLTIFDGFLPESWPAGGVLAIRPPPGSPLLTVASRGREPIDDAALRVAPGATLLEGVSLGTVQFGQVREVTPPEGFSVLLSRGEQPLMLRGRVGASEIAVWAFDLGQGNLTTRLAFPVLVARTVRDLTPSAPPASALLGETITLRPDPRATRLELGAPDGSVELLEVPPGEALTLSLDQPGVYSLAERAGDRTLYTGRLPVNAGAALESDLTPRELPRTIGGSPATTGPADEQRSLWPWLAGGALVVMLVEWLYVHGRPRAIAEI